MWEEKVELQLKEIKSNRNASSVKSSKSKFDLYSFLDPKDTMVVVTIIFFLYNLLTQSAFLFPAPDDCDILEKLTILIIAIIKLTETILNIIIFH